MNYESMEYSRRRTRTGAFPKRSFLTIFLLGTASLLYLGLKPATKTVSPIPEPKAFSFTLPFFAPKKKDPDILKRRVTATINGIFPQYSVLVRDLNGDFVMDINSQTVFTAASVNKLPILGGLYFLSQKNELQLTREVTIQPEDIQNYGTGSIRYDPPGTSYTLRTLARLMMQKSDNTAAYVLGRQVIGFPKLQTIIESWGLSQTDMENNTTSNADMASLMDKMYREKLVNKSLTLEMLSFLTNGELEDRIPAQLPKDAKTYHKTGNAVHAIHDVGIVVGPKTTYYIGMFTADVPDEAQATQMLATVSNVVYDFMKD